MYKNLPAFKATLLILFDCLLYTQMETVCKDPLHWMLLAFVKHTAVNSQVDNKLGRYVLKCIILAGIENG